MDPINPIAGNPEALNSNPVIPERPKDSHGITIAAMAIFVLLALGAVAFLYYQNQQLKTLLASYQSQVNQTTSPSPSAMPTIQETSSPSASMKPNRSATPSASSVVCTQDVKLCSNGSYVARTGPNCEFAPCPTP